MLKYVAYALVCMVLGAMAAVAGFGLADMMKPPVSYLEPGVRYERRIILPPGYRLKYRARHMPCMRAA